MQYMLCFCLILLLRLLLPQFFCLRWHSGTQSSNVYKRDSEKLPCPGNLFTASFFCFFHTAVIFSFLRKLSGKIAGPDYSDTDKKEYFLLLLP